jgi:hypothetical protein
MTKKYKPYRNIYEKAFGKIPKGLQIHHNDRNPDNNDLENLLAITPEHNKWIHSDIIVNPWMHTINWRAFAKELQEVE